LFKGVPRLETKNVGGGGVRGMNGIRECRAVSSSTVGWGGEPDRAVDQRAAATNWGSASCTHTDEVVDAAARQPAWWQVDLGATALVDHVNVWHRTDCCQDRLMSAHVMLGAQPLSESQDMAAFKASAHLCGSLSDYTHAPEVSYCGGKEGRYLVVAHTSSTGDAHLAQDGTTESGGGTSKGEIVTICEARLERSSAV
jgi:hypothetical protein